MTAAHRGEVWTCDVGGTRRPVVILGPSRVHPGRVVVAALAIAPRPGPAHTALVIPAGPTTGLERPNVVRGDLRIVPAGDLRHRLGHLPGGPTDADAVSAACAERRRTR